MVGPLRGRDESHYSKHLDSKVNSRSSRARVQDEDNEYKLPIRSTQLTNIENRIDELKDKVKLNSNKTNAFNRMQVMLKQINEAANSLRNSPIYGDSDLNAFNARTTSYSSNNTVDGGEKYIKVTANPKATLQNYKVEVTKLATNHVYLIGVNNTSGFATKDTALVSDTPGVGQFKAGTFKIKNSEIQLVDGNSLQDIRSAINSLTFKTKVEAEIIQISDNNFQLKVSSTETGQENNFTLDDPDGVFNSLFQSTTQTGEDASFLLDNIEIKRPKNIITDVIDKVTFNLQNVNTPGESVNIQIKQDKTIVREKVEQFLTKYNIFMQFVAQQTEKDPETKELAETAYLGRDPIFNAVLNKMKDALNTQVYNSNNDNNAIKLLYSIGIRTTTVNADPINGIYETKNAYDLDYTIFNEKLESNFEDIKNLFQFTFAGPENKIIPAPRTNFLEHQKFSIKIKTDNLEPPYDTNEKVAILYDDNHIEYADFKETFLLNTNQSNGSAGCKRGFITGRPGSRIEGLKMTYLGNNFLTSDSMDVEINQGIFDRFFVAIEKYENNLPNSIAQSENKTLEDENFRFNSQVERLEERHTTLMEQLSREHSYLKSLEERSKNSSNFIKSLTKSMFSNK